MGQELLTHTDACIVDNKAQNGIVLHLAPLRRREGDFPALAGKFDRIIQNIDQNLLQLHGVADVVIVQNRVHNALIVNRLRGRLRITDGIDSAEKFFHGNFLVLQQHLSAFDPAHIQNIIDQRQQEAGGNTDFGDAVGYLIVVPDGFGRNGTHADNGVHGRPDLMAHPGEEITLGRVRLLCGSQRSRQFLLLALLAPHDIGHIGAHDADPP